MRPGPDQVVACPVCGGLARYRTIASGNTLAMRVWTDGKQVAPMLPRPPAVVKCHHCDRCYWLAEAAKVGRVDRWDESTPADPEWLEAEYVREPAEEEFYEAIENHLARDAEEEKRLRTLAWWRGNDRFRYAEAGEPEAPFQLSAAARKNLEALAGLFGTSDAESCLMKAEVLRELGKFGEARRVLNQVDSVRHEAIVQQLRELCDRGDGMVHKLSL